MRLLLIFAVLLLTACAPYTIQDFEPTKAHFLAHRAEYEALIAKIQLCDEPGATNQTRLPSRECDSGKVTLREIHADMRRLGLKEARWAEDYSQIWLINGDDGHSPLPMSKLGMISGLAYYAAPQTDLTGPSPLTPPPHHWFYTLHD